MAITNGYCSLAEIKAALRIPNADTVDDTLLETAVESASRLVDGFCQRSFYAAGTAVRYFTPESLLLCEIDDLVSVSELRTSTDLDGNYDRVWTTNEYQLEPLNNKVDGLTGWPYTRIRAVTGIYLSANSYFPINNGEASVKVTGVWGWSAVPTAVKQATMIQASRIFKRLDSPLGVLSAPDLGFIRVGSRLDPDVQQLVDPYRQTRFMA